MSMLADQVDAVIGVDTHKASHTAAVVDADRRRSSPHLTVPSDAFGAKRVLAFARQHGPGRRVWAIEGTGSFGAGLTTYLLEQGEWVVEIDRPARPARRDGAKSDELDAVRAAREALVARAPGPAAPAWRAGGPARPARHPAGRRPRADAGDHPTPRRSSSTRPRASATSCATSTPTSCSRAAPDCARASAVDRASRHDHRAALAPHGGRSPARPRPLDLESALELLVEQERPGAPRRAGRRRHQRARHPQRLVACRPASAPRRPSPCSAGVAPIPASSGQTVRHRLNRAGDRQLNRALHTIVLSRLGHHAETRAYAARRAAEGKTPREIKRCLKRHLAARRLFKLLERLGRGRLTDIEASSLTCVRGRA